ncbi:MAG: DMT family transporter [Pseudomonadota bacterium]|nr:DMT family transporter [Pseudomonadota bacterium]
MNKGIIFAILAAVLFGVSTPFAKLLLGEIPPVMLAGLLYGGSGVGLCAWMLFRKITRSQEAIAHLTHHDAPWLVGAVAAGGIAAPVLLMFGITLIPASSASLLLNLEGVFTALLAWFVFKENFDRRIFFGMVFIIAAGVLLSWQEEQTAGIPWGGLLVAAACLCWGIDNNLTRKVSASDPLQIAAIKGSVAGAVNIGIALAMGAAWPVLTVAVGAATVGLAGYGISLVLFVLALRNLGTARTGAYFSVAPFFGAAVSLLLLHENPSPLFWIAGALMGAGIWLHLTEHHEHEHTHEEMAHEHEHIHDEHHRHDHDFPWDGIEPHTHFHVHTRLTHSHSHYPDIHHRHSHMT